MVSAIYQPKIDALQSQMLELQARIERLSQAQTTADEAIEAVRRAVRQAEEVDASEIASLKAVLLDLFGNANQGEQQPVVEDPAIQLEVELVGQSVELCSLLEDCPDEVRVGQVYELCCPLEQNVTAIYKDVSLKSVLTKLEEAISEEAISIDKIGEKIEAEEDLFKLVNLTNSVAYMRKEDGEIIVSYAGFSSKAKAEQWGKWLTVHHSVGSAFEIRPSKRLNNCRYELKLWGLSLKQIQRLTECDFTKAPPSNFGDDSKRKAEVVTFAPKSPQVDAEVAAVMETEAKLEEAAVEEAIASIQPPAPPAPAYNPYPIGRKGANANWRALQASGGLQLKKHGTGIANGTAVVTEEKETEVSPESQAFKIGDSVVVKSARHGEHLLGMTGVIKIANPVGCVVEVGGQTRWFCCDEIEPLTDDFDIDF